MSEQPLRGTPTRGGEPHPPSRLSVAIRPLQSADAAACGQIGFEAHGAVAAAHNVPSEQPSLEVAVGLIQGLLAQEIAQGFVAEREGRIVGSIFLHRFGSVAVIGPLTVHPRAEGGVGRQLMDAALADARRRGIGSVRLVQSPAHLVQESLVLMRGELPAAEPGAARVRPALQEDVAACNALCRQVHGLEREHEVRGAVQQGVATVAERGDQLVGYATGLGFLGHAVAETTDDLKVLIAGASQILGPGFFVPTRNSDLLRWLLDAGLRAAWPATLMSLGPYQPPTGAFLPSIAF